MAFGKFAVDYEQRVDYDRLRREKVAKVKAQMAADGVGAVITWDPDNIRYIASRYVTTPCGCPSTRPSSLPATVSLTSSGAGPPVRPRGACPGWPACRAPSACPASRPGTPAIPSCRPGSTGWPT